MARQDPKKWQAFLARLMNRQPPAPPQPGPWDRPQIDREEERRRAPPREAPPPHVAAPFYTGRSIELGRVFRHHMAGEDLRAQKEVDQRYTTEEGRAHAQDAIDMAADMRTGNQERFQETVEKIYQKIHRMTSDRRPVPPEAALHVNQELADAIAAYESEKRHIAEFVTTSLADADKLEFEAKLIPEDRRLPYKPNRPAAFNQAAREDREIRPVEPVASAEPNPPAEPATPAVPVDYVALFQQTARIDPPGPGMDLDM